MFKIKEFIGFFYQFNSNYYNNHMGSDKKEPSHFDDVLHKQR
jgi:hypothetical protein